MSGGTEEERAKRIAEAEFMRERGLWAAGPWNDTNAGQEAAAANPNPDAQAPADYDARCFALDLSVRLHKEFGEITQILSDAGDFLTFLLAKPAKPRPAV